MVARMLPVLRCSASGVKVTPSPLETFWCSVRAIDGVMRIACCKLRGALANEVEAFAVDVATLVRATAVDVLRSEAEPTTRKLTSKPIAAARTSSRQRCGRWATPVNREVAAPVAKTLANVKRRALKKEMPTTANAGPPTNGGDTWSQPSWFGDCKSASDMFASP